mmetsp:Transcript_26911/g.64076  ORF Transcript_26911/g.64076 Transcript_26911/m.64076 type:complete len:92 (+) Transcript_26911:111-386(+)
MGGLRLRGPSLLFRAMVRVDTCALDKRGVPCGVTSCALDRCTELCGVTSCALERGPELSGTNSCPLERRAVLCGTWSLLRPQFRQKTESGR